MKIYISGPITGQPNRNAEAFSSAKMRLKALGHSSINPLDLDYIEDFGDDWYLNLRRDLKYLVSCDALLLLPGWEESRGAKLEIIVALQLDMPLYNFDDHGELILEHVALDYELTPLIPSYLWK